MGDLDKLIVTKGFENLPKVQQIAQSGHTDDSERLYYRVIILNCFLDMSRDKGSLIKTFV